MSVAQAGWYPDPSGDTTKIRYWDGAQWTDQFQDAPQPAATANADVGAAPATDYAAAQQTAVPTYQAVATAVPYPMTEEDHTLRLIAFIFNVITCVCTGFLLVPLAWTVPMTVHSWGIYNGQKPNTVAFGICTLLFLNIVGGILLLVSTKNEPPVTTVQGN